MSDDEAYDVWVDDQHEEATQREAEALGHVGQQSPYSFEDGGEKPLLKRKVTCHDITIRMEYYPGKAPRFCPCCGGKLA